MKVRPGLTLTGADERTPLEFLEHLAGRFDFVEIGLLWTADPDGRPRYPSREWLAVAIAELRGRCAVHVCGRAARQLALGTAETKATLSQAGRIQLNGFVSPAELLRATDLFPQVITQHSTANPECSHLAVSGHSLLVDASGGRGILPASWERPQTNQPVGFAGGLTPANLAAQLPRIQAAANSQDWWADLESGLRNAEDWFDLHLAWNACITAERFHRDLLQKASAK